MNKEDLIPVITQEECAEVIQTISKVFRFGLEQVHPETGISNRESLETEIGQLYAMLSVLSEDWKLNVNNIYNARLDKKDSIGVWEGYFPEEPVPNPNKP